MPDHSQFNIDRTYPDRWTITFSNPPINMFVPTTIVELGALMTDLEADPSVKVVTFQSANPDFFIAHLDVAKAAERPDVLDLWREFVLRLSSTPVVSIAKIRGRTRGIRDRIALETTCQGAIPNVDNSVVAVLALDAHQQGLAPALNTALWEAHTGEPGLHDEQWLLSYEANMHGWLPSLGGGDHVSAEPNFGFLKAAGVHFYVSSIPIAMPSIFASYGP